MRGVGTVLALVVLATVVSVQGFSLAPVVRRSGLALEPAHTAREEAAARSRLAGAGIARLDELAELEVVPEVVLDRLRRGLTARMEDADGESSESVERVYRQLRRDLILIEAAELQRLYDDHAISDTTRRRLQRGLDLEEARLAE